MESWPTPKNMVCALGPGDSIVDIRNAGEYERWHGFQRLSRDGLSCLDCLGAVNPRMLNKTSSEPARPILVHSPRKDGADAEDKCRSVRSTQRGAGWKKLLKKEIFDYLVRLGYEAKVDPATSGERIDILTRAGSRRIAFRVELDKLKVEDFRAAQQRLVQQEGHTELVWITFGCGWVDLAPAVGIRFREEPPVNRPIDVGGVYPIVDAGIFTFEAPRIKPARPVSLGAFLERFMAGELQNHAIVKERRGWALTAAWEQHIRYLKRKQELAERQRAKSEQDLEQSKHILNEAIRALEKRAAVAEQRASRADGETIRERARVTATIADRDREKAHRVAATAWGDGVEQLRDTSALGRLALRQHPAFIYPRPTEAGNAGATKDWRRFLRASIPWALALAAVLIPLLSIACLVATETAPSAAWTALLVFLSLLPTGTAIVTNGRWCWALDNHSKLRGHRRSNGFFRRCGKREHSLNLFDTWMLLCFAESIALAAWVVLRFSQS